MMEEEFGSRKVLDKVGAEFVEVMFAKSLEEAKAWLEEQRASWQRAAEGPEPGQT